jgi:hypothetical protein
MAYKRPTAPIRLLRGDALTAALVGIGMNFDTPPLAEMAEANIEDALLSASVEALEGDDLRLLSVLTTWLRVHHPRVNADRLLRIVQTRNEPRVRAFWAAVGRWLGSDHKDGRFARFTGLYSGPRLDLLSTETDFHVRRAGEDPRFAGGPLRVPAKTLRDRDQDVLTPAELARHHTGYRWRVLLGPSYRADMWAALERDSSLPAAELARRAYGSFATAWQVKRDRELLGAAPR